MSSHLSPHREERLQNTVTIIAINFLTDAGIQKSLLRWCSGCAEAHNPAHQSHAARVLSAFPTTILRKIRIILFLLTFQKPILDLQLLHLGKGSLLFNHSIHIQHIKGRQIFLINKTEASPPYPYFHKVNIAVRG